MVQSPQYPDLLWMPPKSFTPGRRAGQPTKIGVHYTAGAEGYGNVDIDGAHYCQIRKDGTSAHYFVDADSVTQCVRTTDEAHTALEHGNDDAIHYELCGTAQTREQWLDAASRATIRIAARQMARDMRRHNIPLVRLTGRQVRDRNARGICGHVDFTTGWPEDGGTHTDPGPQFPWDVLFADIQDALNGDDMSAEAENKIDEIHRMLHDGKRMGPDSGQTSNGGIPVAWIVRKVSEIQATQALTLSEVDGTEEGQALILAAVQAIQAGDPDALADAIVAKLGPAQAQAVLDAMHARLAG